MSNLVPTPRTDKNGRIVVRHMKPVASPSATASLPPVNLTGRNRPKYTDEQLVALFGLDSNPSSISEDSCLRAVSDMRKFSPATTELAVSLIEDGNEDISQFVRDRVASAAISIGFYTNGANESQRKDAVKGAWGDGSGEEMVVSWSLIKTKELLAEAAGTDTADYDIKERMFSLHFALTPYSEREMVGKDIDYWNGLALLSFAGIKSVKDGEKGRLFELASWLNEHENSPRAVSLARERGLREVSSLKHLMEQGDTNRPLSSGLL